VSNTIYETDGQADGRTDAGNRIWCILAIKFDVCKF